MNVALLIFGGVRDHMTSESRLLGHMGQTALGRARVSPGPLGREVFTTGEKNKLG